VGASRIVVTGLSIGFSYPAPLVDCFHRIMLAYEALKSVFKRTLHRRKVCKCKPPATNVALRLNDKWSLRVTWMSSDISNCSPNEREWFAVCFMFC
jgi:hypothetical protein